MKANDPMRVKIEALCRHIEEHTEESLTLEALSRHAGTSPFHLQRSFKAIVGVTPKQYAEACRLKALKGGLKRGTSVTDAIYEAGFGSSSRVYEKVDSRLGMTPRQYGEGGRGAIISFAMVRTPVGRLMMAATDRGLCFVRFGTSESTLKLELAAEFPKATLLSSRSKRSGQFEEWMRALTAHLEDSSRALSLPLDVQGTAFQIKVWRYLQKIPVGEARSYSDVARAIGQPRAARAVASACASNGVAIVVPCHRVIRGDGASGGYRWGEQRKQALLERERVGA